jgi:hypothetical protein
VPCRIAEIFLNLTEINGPALLFMRRDHSVQMSNDWALHAIF